MDAPDLRPRSEEDKFLGLRYDDRWEKLKPVIVELYMAKSKTISQVADFMKIHYSFHAAGSQYKSWFRKWGVRKRTMGVEKDAIVSALGKRNRDGTSTSDVLIKQENVEKKVDKKHLQRHLKDRIRSHRFEAMSPGVLSSWNLPYAALAASVSKSHDQPSPFGTAAGTPSHLTIGSPTAVTPGRQDAGPSPSMQLVNEAAIRDRSNLFLQGRHKELLAMCGREDRIALTNYLHDFYIHSFVAAKYWGRGPREWTGGMVSALTMGALDMASPGTPRSIMGSSSDLSPSASHKRQATFKPPTQLCRWSIHVDYTSYEAVPEPARENENEADHFDVQDTSSWPEWSNQQREAASLAESMKKSIIESTFSSSSPEELPISAQAISQSLENDPHLLQGEACKFAIMAGNIDYLESVVDENITDFQDAIADIHPFHLAAAYLDGGKTCCMMMANLSAYLSDDYNFRHSKDDLGHTVLDALLTSILRSHTKILPGQVSASFGDSNRFPGEEKDICGRWDADTPAVRELYRHGFSRIPAKWKHPFCHTAAQAVCHSAIAIFGSPASPDINTFSGLFLRRCAHCGMELKLGPLHTVVVVAFYLSQIGMPEETLFGALAVLVSLLRLGADACLTAPISVDNILGSADQDQCSHAEMTASTLMREVPPDIVDGWAADCKTGWHCMFQTLLLAERGRILRNDCEQQTPRQEVYGDESTLTSNQLRSSTAGYDTHSEWGDGQLDSEDSTAGYDTDTICCELDTENFGHVHSDWLRIPGGNPELGLLWATIQVELLTYRRVEGDPWISNNFSMHGLRTWLEGKSSAFSTPLVERKMMKDHTPCGWFPCKDFVSPVAENVCREHFMNMDIYDRTSFIYRPYFCEVWANIEPASP